MGQVETSDGTERCGAPSARGRGYLYSAGLIRMVGTERGLFGKIDTYGWGEARLIRQDQYVWLGRPVESKPPPEGSTLRIGIPWLIDRNTEIALSVRRNCSIRAP